ncbi:exo-alpha-sialidase [Aquipuribacter nitratireducens]|uniref:WD40/YVTN/BNR-like repeat-containing protein n=1 Tax=Aquipuribacter nitratireducens TaxID=650104 RepID=A0ABW0GL08_9MICO
MTTLLAIGTRKGLWLATTDDRRTWQLSEPHLLMHEVPAVALDTRGGRTRLLVGTRSEHWGPTVVRSDDLGATWQEPDHGAIRFPDDTDAALERVWQIRPDAAERPGVVWAGCEPISVWRSTDGGEHFDLVRGLWDHPHRSEWGAGYGGAAAHTVLPSPVDDTVHVAMSTGGVYRSDDGGATWAPRNTGISAYFMPGPEPEFGQCVHKVARDAEDPRRLYAQNHHGVYRSDDAGDTWHSIAEGLPSDFGFAVLADPRTGGRVWVVPLVADAERVPPGGRLAVHRSDDAGRTWTTCGDGLPDGHWNAVLRDAACVDDDDPTGVYLGSRSGEVWASRDGGDGFVRVADGLPDVLCVRAARLP